jgi:hypothetical protein
MMRKRTGTLVFLFASVARLATGQAPVGAEFQVNVHTTDDQRETVVAVRPDGSFVVVWSSENQDGSSYGVFGRRYDAAGTPGSEIRVNSYTTSSQRWASIAATTSGFVVVWHSNLQDGSTYGVFGQLYDASFAPQGSEFRLNSYTSDFQNNPAVAPLPGGGFVVAWHSGLTQIDVFVRRFDAAGSPQGAEFRVNTFTTNYQGQAAIASNAAGNFVVTWSSLNQDGSMSGVFGQRFSAAGSPLGGEFAVNTYTSFPQASSAVAMDDAGNFVVMWSSNYEDGSQQGIFGRRYNPAGTPSAPFPVNVFTSFAQHRPAVAMDESGGFVVVWEGSGVGNEQGVWGRSFNGAAVPVTGEFRINTYTTSNQQNAAIARDPDGTFVVAWESRDQDGHQYGIFGQRIGGSDLIFADGFEGP